MCRWSSAPAQNTEYAAASDSNAAPVDIVDILRLLQNGDGRIGGALSTGGGTPGQGYPSVFSTVHAIQMAHAGSHGAVIQRELSHTLEQSAPLAIHNGFTPRRLMPHECEALQGLPRGYTRIAWRGRRAEVETS